VSRSIRFAVLEDDAIEVGVDAIDGESDEDAEDASFNSIWLLFVCTSTLYPSCNFLIILSFKSSSIILTLELKIL
jgi:hypothetical protein